MENTPLKGTPDVEPIDSERYACLSKHKFAAGNDCRLPFDMQLSIQRHEEIRQDQLSHLSQEHGNFFRQRQWWPFNHGIHLLLWDQSFFDDSVGWVSCLFQREGRVANDLGGIL
jgi:hypothetical protein